MKVLVAGSGPVGLLTALHCQEAGFEVICVGQRAPERTAGAGGSAVVAPQALMPLATPGLARELAPLLAGRHPAGHIAMAYLPSLLPWLARSAAQGRRGRVRTNIHALAALLARAESELTPWLRTAGAGDLLRRHGSLALAEGARGQRHCARLETLARAQGIGHQRLAPAAVAELEPALVDPPEGLYFPQAFHAVDPTAALKALGRLFRDRGGRLEVDRIGELRPDSYGGIRARGEHLGELRADRAAIAAGTGSRRLAARLGDRVPLASAAGYHVDFPDSAGVLTRPVALPASGVTLAPHAGGLRAAGRWVFAGELLPPGERELNRLAERARSQLTSLGALGPGWAGYRPVTPDAVPVIGRSGAGGDIVYAFGHGELGLALSGVTGRLATDLLAYREPGLAPRPYRPQRFRWLG